MIDIWGLGLFLDYSFAFAQERSRYCTWMYECECVLCGSTQGLTSAPVILNQGSISSCKDM